MSAATAIPVSVTTPDAAPLLVKMRATNLLAQLTARVQEDPKRYASVRLDLDATGRHGILTLAQRIELHGEGLDDGAV